jgi:TolA-binding protein
LANKGKNPPPEKDSAKPGSAPEETIRPTEEPEVVPPQESFPPALAPALKPKKEKKSSGLWGILFFFFLIIAGGIGGGGYYLYQEQMKFQNETFAKFSQLESQLNALDTEADQARQNQQSIDTLNQELKQFKAEIDTTLNSHQNSLTTLDEDVMRLKEKVTPPAETPPAPLSVAEGTDTEAGPLPGELFPDNQDDEALEDTEAEEDDSSQESQKFVEWMENFFAAIWNWFTSLFN